MELSQINYYNFLAIRNNYLKPLNKFMSNDEIYLVINKYIFNKKFFSIPFFLTASLDDLKGIKNNIFGTKTICDVAEKCKVDKVVVISTDKAVRPTNIMGASKRLAEMVVQSKNSV